jgi:cell wall-associated NlpC family hydrolase
MEVILGAKSLDEVLTRFDTESRVSSTDAEVLDEVVTYKGAVNRHRRVLERKRAEVRRLVAARKAQQQTIRIQLVERAQLLNSIQGEIARLQAEERARQLQMARLAQARLEQAQLDAQSARMAASASTEPVVGATALTPEGATVVPSSRYGGAVGVAMSELGTPYVWAGAAPGGFDCSGLVVYSYAQEGVSLPHSSYALWNEGVPVAQDQLQPGDLVFFNGLGHVGIYIGDDEFVHAPHTGTVVSVSSLSSYGGGFVGARRIP